MRRTASFLALFAIAAVPIFVSSGARAANTGGAAPPVGVGTGTPGGSSGGGSILPKPSLHYPFNGDSKDELGGYTLATDPSAGVPLAWVAGPTGQNPGAVQGLLVYPGTQASFFAYAWTLSFHLKMENSRETQELVTLFSDGLNTLSVTAVAKGNVSALQQVIFDFQTESSHSQITTSSQTGAWEEIHLSYDGATRKMTLNGSSTVLSSPLKRCQPIATNKCEIRLGGPRGKGHFAVGELDDFKLYPTASLSMPTAKPQNLNTTQR